ncbi:septum site-determining protein MinC [Spiribacter onubensis]|uniref:Probable septum site-determining protein MinC n=1 Tax=Spiribacter onubensis TaxID=3122420 RepID=A0ABV3S668_9GAMM
MAVSQTSGAAFELKGRMATLTVLRLLSADPGLVFIQLDARLAQAPGFFDGMPLVLAPGQDVSLDAAMLETLVAGLRDRGLLPVAVADVSEDVASVAGLGVLRNLGGSRSEASGQAARGRSEKPAAEPRAHENGAARLVTQPVRSGQQVYARGGDLVVSAPVSAGAELMADGHIHVYGTLRGRALAGVQGDVNARIFCQSLEAELVAVAGHYRLSEQIDAGLRGAPAMIRLRGDELEIDAL